MALADSLKRWLSAPPVSGAEALFWATLAVAVPTAVRGALQGVVSGCETIPFVPFVLLSAVFLGWRYATFVAIAAAWSSDLFFIGHGHRLFEGPCDVFGDGTFLLSSAMIIALVEGARSQLQTPKNLDLGEKFGGIVFSLREGEAWASWYGGGSPVRLGPDEAVAEMMEDFLAQLEFGKRLNAQSD